MAGNDEMKSLAREVGARSVGQLEAGLARIMAEAGPNSRWLLGALVLLNGGGIALVAAQTAGLAPQALAEAISLFVIGAALAVLAGLGSALGGLLLTRQIGGASALWAQVASSGDISDDALKAAAGVRRTGLIASLATMALALVSLILFVGGALTLGSGLAPTQAAPEAAIEMPGPAPVMPANAAAAPAPAPQPPKEEAPAKSEPEPKAQPVPKAQPAPQPKTQARPAPAPARQAPAPAQQTAPAPPQPAGASPVVQPLPAGNNP